MYLGRLGIPYGEETLCHTPCSLDFSTRDYYLFHPLQTHLHEKSFTNETGVEKVLADFFPSKTHVCLFLPPGHCAALGTLAKVLEADRHYFEKYHNDNFVLEHFSNK